MQDVGFESAASNLQAGTQPFPRSGMPKAAELYWQAQIRPQAELRPRDAEVKEKLRLLKCSRASGVIGKWGKKAGLRN